MRQFVGLLLAASLAGGAALAQEKKAADSMPDFKGMVQKLLDAWGTMDTSNPAPFYAPEARHVYFDIAPMKYSGWKAYAEGAAKLLAPYQSAKFTMNPDFVAHRRGNVAWATYTWHVDLARKDGGKEAMDGRATELWEKRGDQWLIVHEHFSVPLPMEPPKKP